MTELDKTRAAQATLFQTEGGELLRVALCNVGHIGEVLKDDTERVEHNTVMKLLHQAGVMIKLVPAPLPEPGEQRNVTEDYLGGPHDD